MQPATVIRDYITAALPGLSDVERDDTVAVLVACVDEGLTLLDAATRLTPVLLHARYTWPALDEARRLFRDVEPPPVWLPVFDPRGGEAIRREEILLIAQSALGACQRARQLESLIESRRLAPDFQVEVFVDPDSDCPVCLPYVGQRFDAALVPEIPMPPYHVACGCLLVAYREEWAAFQAEIDRHAERSRAEARKTWSPQALAAWEARQVRRRQNRS